MEKYFVTPQNILLVIIDVQEKLVKVGKNYDF